MKSIYNYLLIIAVLFTTACGDEFLEQTPQQSVDTDLAISTLADANIALNGCYDNLQEETLIGRNYYVICDIATDNSKMRPENSGRFLNYYYWTATPSSDYISDLWLDAYETINRVNNILVRIDELEGSEAEKARIKGEAAGLRALTHLMLVNMFSQAYAVSPNGQGIPIMLEPAPVDYEPARNTISEVYTQILADLDLADNNLSYSANNIYFSKGAAKALKSRIYLYMENWANAKTEAETLINSGMYSLADYAVNTDNLEGPADYYIDAWAQASNSETIFNLGFTETDYLGVNALGSMYLKEGYGDVIPTADLMDLYSDTDLRNYWFYKDGDYTYTSKYPGIEGTKIGVDNITIARLSEVYLNAAEANYQLGNEDLARAQLDEIIGRADASAPATTETAGPLREKIYLERRKELAYEGHRFWDLKRWDRDIVRTDRTVENAIALIQAGSNDYAYPIPQTELNVNGNITQNPGY